MSPNQFYQDIKSIVKKVNITDNQTFKVLNKEFHVAYKHAYMKWNQPINVFGQNLGEEKQAQSNLSSQVASAIYGQFYCLGKTNMKTYQDLHSNTNYPDKNKRDKSIAILSKLNTTEEKEDKLWNVYNIDQSGNAFVTKNGEVRYLVPNQWTFSDPKDQQLKIGAYVNLKVQKEDTQVQEVFYHVRSQEIVSQQASFLRIYFNTNFEGAKILVNKITTLFNKYSIPFLFKCLNHPDLFNRTDSAVLYVNRAYSRIGFQLLLKIIPDVVPHLKKEIPLFSLPIIPGIGFSEDPGDGQSFGMSRCKILGEALVDSYNKSQTSDDEKFEIAKDHFKKNGIDIDKIYLKPNSEFPYDFSVLNGIKS